MCWRLESLVWVGLRHSCRATRKESRTLTCENRQLHFLVDHARSLMRQLCPSLKGDVRGDCTLFQSCIKRKVIRHKAKSRLLRLNTAQAVRGTKYIAQQRVCPGRVPSVKPSHKGLCVPFTPNTFVFWVRLPEAARITAHIAAILSSRFTGAVLCLPLPRDCSAPERRQNL